MTWHEFTYDASEGMSALFQQLGAALDPHPAWERVDTYTEDFHGDVYDVTYENVIGSQLVYRNYVQVWKSLGAHNGSGHDFHVVFAYQEGYSYDGDTLLYTFSDGDLAVIAAKDFDPVTRTFSRRYGVAPPNGSGMMFDAEGRYIQPAADYPLLRYIEEPGGTTLGSWLYPGKYVQGVDYTTPAEKQRLLDLQCDSLSSLTSGRYLDTTYVYSNNPKAVGAYTFAFKMRVRSDGIWMYVISGGTQGYAYYYSCYVGFYEKSTVVPELASDFPFMLLPFGAKYLDTYSTYGGLALDRYPGISTTEQFSAYSTMYELPSLGAFGRPSYGTQPPGDTDRNFFMVPGDFPFFTLPWGVNLSQASYAGNGMFPVPLYQVPGLFILSTNQMPVGWVSFVDTLTGPDGDEYLVFSNAPFGDYEVFLIHP